MKQVSHLRSLRLSLFLALAFVFSLPSIAAGQCEGKDCADCDTVARFASALPRLSAAELKQAKFSAEEVDRYHSEFVVSYRVNEKMVFQEHTGKRDTGIDGSVAITPTRERGYDGLLFMFLYGAGRNCQFVVFPHVNADGSTSWQVIPARSPVEELSLEIAMVTGEHSRDSNSTSTSLTIEGNKLVYEQTYHGFHANRRDPVQKEYELTPNDRNVLIGLLRQKNLLVNKSLTGSSPEEGVRTYFSLSVNSKLNGKAHSITIDGSRNDAKLKATRFYRDSVFLIEQLYKIINRTDPDITMPELIN